MRPSVLIVDDSLTVRMDLNEAFRDAGFETSPCATLAMAREAIKKTTFSLILLDVLLPDGDGVEFLGEIKKSPSTASVPVMLLSTEAEVSDQLKRRMMIEARAAGNLRHPNIVTIYDLGLIDGLPFIAMEYLEGMDLGRIIRKHPRVLLRNCDPPWKRPSIASPPPRAGRKV